MSNNDSLKTENESAARFSSTSFENLKDEDLPLRVDKDYKPPPFFDGDSTVAVQNLSAADIPMKKAAELPSVLKTVEPDLEPVRFDTGEPSSSKAAAPAPSQRHNRNVSWGHSELLIDGSIRSLNDRDHAAQKSHRPTLSGISSLGGDSAADVFSTANSSNNNTNNYKSNKNENNTASTAPTLINLSDVIQANPLEQEAQTLMIKVLEQQTRGRTNTGNSSIFFNVPDGSAAFENENDDNDDIENPCTNNDSANFSNSRQPSLRTDSEGQPLIPSTTSDTLDTPNSSRLRLQRMKSVRNKGMKHKRQTTMEQTLFGLSNAIAGLHQGFTDSLVEEELETGYTGYNAGGAVASLTNNATKLFQTTSYDTTNKKEDASDGAVSVLSDTKSQTSFYRTNDSVMNDVDVMPTTVEEGDDDEGAGVGKYFSERMETQREQEDGDDGEQVIEFTSENNQTSPPSILSFNEGESHLRQQESAAGSGKKLHAQSSKRFGKGLTRGGQGVISDAKTFASARFSALRLYVWTLSLIVAPAVGIAFILFYFVDNPPTGRMTETQVEVFDPTTNLTTFTNDEGERFEADNASASWWLMFVCVRQLVTFSLAKLLEVIVIDFLSLSTKFTVRCCGQLVTLFIVQSKGWPFLLFFWGLFNLVLNSGSAEFAEHWGYWQDYLGIFNDANPSGSFPNNATYQRALSIALVIGAIVAFKRLWLGFFLGRKIYRNYAEELTKTMKKIILLSKVALLARDLAREAQRRDNKLGMVLPSVARYGMSQEQFKNFFRADPEDDIAREQIDTEIDMNSLANISSTAPSESVKQDQPLIDDLDPDAPLTQTDRNRIIELLGEWEDPVIASGVEEEEVSINAILQFRQSLSFIESRFMFGLPFGDVGTRESMIRSSQKVFQRLNVACPSSTVITFETLAIVALDEDGDLDEATLKELIRLLRPDREGHLTALEFVKSVDTVYKEAKLLRASVKNSEKIDQAFEKVINTVFYIFLGCIVLSQLGFNPFALFLSLSSIILAFAFMIGSASSKMFEGWLFILVQRPYDIGDCIHVSSPQSNTDWFGSHQWMIKDVTLFTTTMVLVWTNERATVSNGALASSRIINMTRSPQACIYVILKFSTEAEHEKIKLFEYTLRRYVRHRPRTWASFYDFRATTVSIEHAYIEYLTILVHRDSWDNIGAIKSDMGQVAGFCLELSKKLDLRYTKPPLPIKMSVDQAQSTEPAETSTVEASKTDFSVLGMKFGAMQQDVGASS